MSALSEQREQAERDAFLHVYPVGRFRHVAIVQPERATWAVSLTARSRAGAVRRADRLAKNMNWYLRDGGNRMLP